MTVKELKEYLSRWPEDADVRFLAVIPVIGIMLYESETMDEELVRAMEEDESAEE